MVDNKNLIHPELIINGYTQEQIKYYIEKYTGFDKLKEYDEKNIPFISVNASNLGDLKEEFEQRGLPYVVWSSFSNPRSVPRTIYPIKSGQLMYEIVAFTTEDLYNIRSFILNLLDRNDESGKDINDFIDGTSFKIDSIDVSATSNSDYRTVTVYPKITPIKVKNEEAFKLSLTKNAEKELISMNQSLNGLYTGSSSSASISLNIPEGYFSASSPQSYFSFEPNPKKPGENIPLGTIRPLLGKQIYFHCTSVFQLNFVDALTKENQSSVIEKLIIKYDYHQTNIFEEINEIEQAKT